MWLLVLNAYLCSLNLIAKLRPLCPTYTLLQSGHINLYAPERAYLLGVWCWGISSLWIVLVVSQATFRSVFLNKLVTNLVSLPINVNDVCRLGVGGLCVWVGNPLLDRMP